MRVVPRLQLLDRMLAAGDVLLLENHDLPLVAAAGAHQPPVLGVPDDVRRVVQLQLGCLRHIL